MRLTSSRLRQNYNKSQAALGRKRQIDRLDLSLKIIGSKSWELTGKFCNFWTRYAWGSYQELWKHGFNVGQFWHWNRVQRGNCHYCRELGQRLFSARDGEKKRPAANSKKLNSQILQSLWSIRDITQEHGTCFGTSRKQLAIETIELSQMKENHCWNKYIVLTTESTADMDPLDGLMAKERHLNA